jgi:phage tail-like protein
MGKSRATVKLTYPLPVYNYRVMILDQHIPYVLGFSEVSGLSVSHEPVTYKHGLSFLTGDKIMPGMRQPIKLTLKKGLTVYGDFLQTWFDRCYLQPWSSANKCDIVIDLCDELGLPSLRWKLIQAMPTKLDAPTLTASSNEVAIASMELIATNLTTDYHPI